MKGWVNKRKDEWIKRWINAQMHKCTNEFIYAQMHKCINERMNKWKKERKKEWKDERMNKRINDSYLKKVRKVVRIWISIFSSGYNCLHVYIIPGHNIFLSIKGIVNVISSDLTMIEWHIPFTMLPLKALSDQV